MLLLKSQASLHGAVGAGVGLGVTGDGVGATGCKVMVMGALVANGVGDTGDVVAATGEDVAETGGDVIWGDTGGGVCVVMDGGGVCGGGGGLGTGGGGGLVGGGLVGGGLVGGGLVGGGGGGVLRGVGLGNTPTPTPPFCGGMEGVVDGRRLCDGFCVMEGDSEGMAVGDGDVDGSCVSEGMVVAEGMVVTDGRKESEGLVESEGALVVGAGAISSSWTVSKDSIVVMLRSSSVSIKSCVNSSTVCPRKSIGCTSQMQVVSVASAVPKDRGKNAARCIQRGSCSFDCCSSRRCRLASLSNNDLSPQARQEKNTLNSKSKGMLNCGTCNRRRTAVTAVVPKNSTLTIILRFSSQKSAACSLYAV